MRLKPKQKRSDLRVNISDLIAEDNEIRFIDAFVEKVDILSFGIKYKTEKVAGKDLGGPPEYDPKAYLRLYIYGYLNKIRSCRDLAKACERNIEVIWLLRYQTPKRNAINEFRSTNALSLFEIYKSFNSFWQDLGLFGEAQDLKSAQSEEESYLTFAVDGSKFRSQNSKSNNYNEDKIEEGIVRWNNKAAQYLADLAALEDGALEGREQDAAENTEQDAAVENTEQDAAVEDTAVEDVTLTQSIESQSSSCNEAQEKVISTDCDKNQSNQSTEDNDQTDETKLLLTKLELARKQQTKYENLKAKMQQTGQSQVSATDPDARLFKEKNKTGIVGYNVQIACEQTNKMVAHFEVTNKGDSNAFFQIAKPTKDFLTKGNQDIKVNGLGDKGFDTGEQIHLSSQYNIITYIAHNQRISGKKEAGFNKIDFTYLKKKDIYICPVGASLITTDKLYKKRNGKVKEYRADFKKDCKDCPFRDKCLAPSNIENKKGRVISRPEFEDATQANKERVANNKEMYQKRKEIVEHPFGTIKRNWGYTYTLLKGIPKVTGEFALIFTAYNLRRAISILGINALVETVNKLESIVFSVFLQNLLVWLSITTMSRNKKNLQQHL